MKMTESEFALRAILGFIEGMREGLLQIPKDKRTERETGVMWTVNTILDKMGDIYADVELIYGREKNDNEKGD